MPLHHFSPLLLLLFELASIDTLPCKRNGLDNHGHILCIFDQCTISRTRVQTVPTLLLSNSHSENIFEWQFAIRGPCDSEFEGGICHGRIQLPAEYPFKPPSFMLLTTPTLLTTIFVPPSLATLCRHLDRNNCSNPIPHLNHRTVTILASCNIVKESPNFSHPEVYEQLSSIYFVNCFYVEKLKAALRST
ncbi:Ubiquitin-conjugating enzyme E2 32 [Camellia lanceoleosa]|uniref:Ubiquitin-conjugating enzyme E2 32 n=1 Tax=Camellia lanceoleosa TaxID=1840588 RepID=A0ACC0HC13_9ERIC|nr:Ubiquitin-conjugating enzyme E2 32 [Camellia lanceoleosa]